MRKYHLFLHFILSYFQYTKHVIDDFLHEQLLHLRFEHDQVYIIGLMLSITASYCQCGTNELSGSSFQPHSIGWSMLVSISLSFQMYPAWIHARFICWKNPDGDRSNIQRFILGVQIRWRVCCILKEAYFAKPYAT